MNIHWEMFTVNGIYVAVPIMLLTEEFLLQLTELGSI